MTLAMPSQAWCVCASFALALKLLAVCLPPAVVKARLHSLSLHVAAKSSQPVPLHIFSASLLKATPGGPHLRGRALLLRSFEAWPQALALQGRRAFVALRWGDGRSGRVAGLDLVTGCMLPGKLSTSSPGPLVVRP